MERAIVTVTRPVPGRIEAPGAEVRTGPDRALNRAELLALIAGSRVVVTMFNDGVDAGFLDAAGPGLAGVVNFAVGHENIDLEACARRGVAVAHTPHAVTDGTADMAWALVLAVARRLVEADRFARSDEYAARGPLGINEFLGLDLTGRTLLIVGAGRIGYAVAQRSLGWGMRVLYVARRRHVEFELAPLAAERVDLEEGVGRADVVSIHLPLTEQTRHMIDARVIGLMRPRAILVNTARGAVVDEAALARALGEGRIWGAGLDVFEDEPRVNEGLRGLGNAVLSPHIGSAAERWRLVMTEMVSENVRAILEGRPAPNGIAAGGEGRSGCTSV